jgi:uncharacterized membrane protein YedE/YeeE
LEGFAIDPLLLKGQLSVAGLLYFGLLYFGLFCFSGTLWLGHHPINANVISCLQVF